jgi:hypothetical protein
MVRNLKKRLVPKKKEKKDSDPVLEENTQVLPSITTDNTNQVNRNTLSRNRWYVFCAWYSQTGNPELSHKQAGYQTHASPESLVARYQADNLPPPLSSAESAAVLELLAGKVSNEQLASVLADSIINNRENRAAQTYLELVLERERQAKVEQYRELDIEQRFRWAIEDSEILSVITACLNLQGASDLILGLSFWQETALLLGQEKLLEVKALIDKALDKNTIPVYIHNEELSDKNESNSQPKRRPGRPKKQV